ncbi:MAG: hypothetical protein GF331_22370, partial [Chitinivibrionales bacterium]|nr:hypothetical protein [Chitinivibrionales bacterium]
MLRKGSMVVSTLCTVALLITAVPRDGHAAGFAQRAQEVLTFYAENPSMFSRTDDVTGYAKSGIYHAMAHYATGDIAGGNEITTHIFNNVGGGSMFLVMAGMDCYLRYKQHMPDALKSRIRSFVTGYGEYPFGSTENHHLMSGTGGYLASEEWPDWSKASTVKSACREHLHGFIDKLAKKGIAEYDSPTYLAFDINCMLSLYDHARDPQMKQRAQIGLEILLADMAGEWVGGSWASSTLRTHQFCHDATDGTITGLTGYVYFGGVRMPVQSDGAGVMNAVSTYRLPAVIERMATDRSQPVTHLETHMAWHGARKTTYLDRTYGVFSQYDGNGSLFWSDQMHRAGVVWTSTIVGAKFIVKHPKSGIVGETATNQVMQHEGVLVGVAKESMTGYVPQSGTVLEQREQDGWLFLDGGTVYIAFTSAGGYTWGGTVTVDGVNPRYLIWDHSNWETVYRTFTLGGGTNKGWVIQTANPLDYAGFDAFVNNVLTGGSADISGVGNSNPTMKYTTIDGDRLQITFDGSGGGGGTDRRLVNGTPLDYANWPRMHNPWVHADLY